MRSRPSKRRFRGDVATKSGFNAAPKAERPGSCFLFPGVTTAPVRVSRRAGNPDVADRQLPPGAGHFHGSMGIYILKAFQH